MSPEMLSSWLCDSLVLCIADWLRFYWLLAPEDTEMQQSEAANFKSRITGSPSPETSAKKSPSPVPVPVPGTHPPTRDMVDASIKSLNERGGFSYLAIKKYIAAEYKCDAQKLTPFIKKYLKSAVADGKLIQTSGTGASGSFKLSASVERTDKEAKKERKAKNTASPKRAARAATRSQMRNEAKMLDAAKKTARRG
ncbi:GL15880 [Drosophila persimilis]|uniref:GL15880 n=1 Tax=Drosophila persimilis TaxID=7234 RepID=B4H0W9_DROPE|nr:GL15880 [Drosophila persimilis]